MENQQTLFKGELMEELVRIYLLTLGYYVVRGAKFKYEGNDITDIDLFLYGRSSTINRERINVDIKNKKTPQTFERIVWANGLMKLLKFDSCIVATTDYRPITHSFAEQYNTKIFDGSFLTRLRTTVINDRLTEEELLSELSANKSYKTFPNKDWRSIYETSKSRLLTELDYSGFNSSSPTLEYFIEKSITDVPKRNIALRMTYLVISHLLIITDFICKDVAFLEPEIRAKKLSDGFKFGNLGQEGIDKIISIAARIGGKPAQALRDSLDSLSVQILTDFFSRNDNMKNLFAWAKEFENLAFKIGLVYPDRIETSLKGVIAVFLDYFGVERKTYFESLKTTTGVYVQRNVTKEDNKKPGPSSE